MCLTIESRRRPRLKKAKEDIVVYKKVFETFGEEKRFISYLQSFAYIPNATLPRVKIKFNNMKVFRSDCNKWVVEEGYHFYLSPGTVPIQSGYSRERMVKFIIPKGTRYVESRFVEMGVAENIVCTGEIVRPLNKM